MSIALRFVLLMSARPNLSRPGKDREGAGRQRGQQELWTPNIIPKKIKSTRVSGCTSGAATSRTRRMARNILSRK
jgi:hypothetical protein